MLSGTIRYTCCTDHSLGHSDSLQHSIQLSLSLARRSAVIVSALHSTSDACCCGGIHLQ